MFQAQCQGCGTAVVVTCQCPPEAAGYVAAFGHLPACPMANLDALVVCPPAALGCCQVPHDHAAAANACPGGHGACPEPASCALHAAVKAHYAALAAHQAADPGGWQPHMAAIPGPAELPDNCPGGHCHKDIDGCTVCRPLTITHVGLTTVRPVTGG